MEKVAGGEFVSAVVVDFLHEGSAAERLGIFAYEAAFVELFVHVDRAGMEGRDVYDGQCTSTRANLTRQKVACPIKFSPIISESLFNN